MFVSSDRKLTLSELSKMYAVTRSTEIIETAQNLYGLAGVMKIDLSVAFGYANDILERGTDSIMFFMKQLKSVNDAKVLLYLMLTIIKELKDSDERFTNFVDYLNKINLNNTNPQLQIVYVDFIKSILSHCRSEEYKQLYDRSREVYTSIATNPTLNESDLFEVYIDYPELATEYIVNYKKIIDDRRYEFTDMAYLHRFGFNFTKLLVLLYRLQMQLESNIEAVQNISVHEYLVEVMEQIIIYLCEYENPRSDDTLAALFLECSKNSLVFSSEPYIDITRLFWATWYSVYCNNVKEDVKYHIHDMENAHGEEMREVFSDYDRYIREIQNGTNDGLIYALYYRELLDKNPLAHFDQQGKIRVVDDYVEAASILIEFGVLPQEFLNDPDVYYFELLPKMFPSVTRWRPEGESHQESMDGNLSNLLDSMEL